MKVLNRRQELIKGNQKTLDKLKAFTAPCRADMHEPDEQGIKVAIVGDHLDNASGTHISPKAICEGFQEYVVVLRRFQQPTTEGGNDGKFLECKVNLADLIALARKARLEEKYEEIEDGFTILFVEKGAENPGSLMRTHGSFSTKEEAQSYIDSGASILMPDGDYYPLANLVCSIIRHTSAG